MRRRRFSFFLSLLAEVKRPVRILDAGGTSEFWQLMGLSHRDDIRVTILNRRSARLSKVSGDARGLARYADSSFDVLFSNSVIEHLG